MNKHTEILDEFGNKFAHVKETDAHYYNPWLPDIKDFLLKALQAQDEAWIKKIQKVYETITPKGFEDPTRCVNELSDVCEQLAEILEPRENKLDNL